MSSSWQMRVIGGLLRLTSKRRYATEAGGRERMNAPKGSPEPPEALVRGRVHERYERNGFTVVVLGPRDGLPRAEGRAVVYLHGGAFINEIVKQHWHLVADIADELGLDVHVPIYGLAPQHHADEAVALVRAVVAELVADGRSCQLVGDSAGGGLALLVAQATPASITGVTVMAPWLDLSMSNPDVPAVERVDPWLSRAGMVPAAAAWANGVPLRDPKVSPLFGALTGLPPVAVWVGTRDVTMPDCRLLRDRLAGEPGFRYTELDGALHVYPLLAAPEGRAARRDLITHLAAVFAGG